jgi:azurin
MEVVNSMPIALAVACLLVSGSPAALVDQKPKTAAARTIEIVGTDDMKFDVTRITAKPGERIRIVLRSVGKMPRIVMAHNVVVLRPDVDVTAFASEAAMARTTAFIPPARKADIIAATALVGNGETVDVTFTVPDQPGEYPYVCSFPGHTQAGMRGILQVK